MATKRNSLLKILLGEVERIVDGAKKESAFEPAFDKLKTFKAEHGEIRFDHSAKFWISGVFFAVSAILAVLTFAIKLEALQVLNEDWLFIPWVVLVAGFAIPLIIAAFDSSTINSISKRMFDKDIFFDNGLSYIKPTKWAILDNKFGDFSRGNEGRCITTMVAGTHEFDEYQTPFKCYTFEYVVVYYVPVSNGKGGTRMERRTRTEWRYGFLADFSWAKGLALVSNSADYGHYNKIWKPTSNDLKKAFDIYCNDELTASKFLKPAVVEALLKAKQSFSGLNIEITGNGELCISFDDSNALKTAGRKYSIAEPVEFEAEINGFLALPKLETLFWLYNEMKRFNDSNF